MTLELNLKQDVKQALEGAAFCAGLPLEDYVARVLEREAAINAVRIVQDRDYVEFLEEDKSPW